ncbi:MAG TPA: hypothetical protein VLH39_00845 [Magnetospirillaceae bacterium]|nr:hypothetical protein [Magnetospirillaceae bacterium]
MREDGFAVLKALASELQGAPFPNTVNRELYAIWYEHAQRIAQDALEYLAENAPGYGPKTQDMDI